MRILVLAPDLPWPVIHGGRLRILGLVRCLARFASVHVLAAADPHSDAAGLSRDVLGRWGVGLEVFQPEGPGAAERDPNDTSRLPDAAAHFRCPGLRERLPAVCAEFRPDLVHVEELVMAQYLDLLPRPRVLDRQKPDAAFLRALAAGQRSEAERFARWERAVAGEFERVLVLGAGDRAALAPVFGAERLHVVPNGVADELRRPASRTASVSFVLLYGSLDYGPNIESNAIYFREVWPRLRAALPELRTLVAGSGADPGSVPRADSRVELRGFVPEIGPLLRGPGVLVVPLRVGGGARNKILEALACGMPVVSTAVGAENLGVEAGRHFLVAETPGEIVEAVTRLVRDPGLAAELGRAGAEHVEEHFRWDAIGDDLETLYREAAGLPAAPRRRVLLVGVRPWPGESQARRLSFPGHRTAAFHEAIASSGAEVACALLDEDPGSPGSEARGESLPPEEFRAGGKLQAVHDRLRPHVVVAAGGYHAARVVAHLKTAAHRFIDLPGDLAAEAQLRAERAGHGAADDALSVLASALRAGDAFSVVGPSQRLATLGQLGLLGRLDGGEVGEDPVFVVPISCDGPELPPALPEGALRVLWCGGYNTWMDVETVIAGLEAAMARNPALVFVSTGGSVPGHDEETHARFWDRARRSAFAARFEDRGWLGRGEALAMLASCHVVLAISRRCLEAELGSRLRVVEAAAYGRPSVLTDSGDLAGQVKAAGAGLAVEPGDAASLAEAIHRIAADRAALQDLGSRARRLWEQKWCSAATSGALRRFLERPRRWPASMSDLDALPSGSDVERFRLQADLDTIRASKTFRALRLIDRLTGRAPKR